MFQLQNFRIFALVSIFLNCLAMNEAFAVLQESDNATNREQTNTAKTAVVYSGKYVISFPELELARLLGVKLHSFDIKKYPKIVDALKRDQLLADENIFSPEQVSEKQLLLVHKKEYLKKLKSAENVARYLELPRELPLPEDENWLDKNLLTPFRYSSGGTVLAAQKSLEHGIGINVGGGYHHAKPDKGEGFCIYADVPIAIRILQKENKIKRALIVDVDAHQGNGTIVCLPDDETTFTFSMHQSDIYPIPKEQGDWDIELEEGTTDRAYLELLEKSLPKLFADAGSDAGPDIVFIVGGCDTLAADPLAGLAMTERGIAQRDRMIVDACVARKIPVVLTLAGGYSENAWHAQYLSLSEILKKYPAVQKR